MHTYSHLNPFYQNLVNLHIHAGKQHTHIKPTIGHILYGVLTNKASWLGSDIKTFGVLIMIWRVTP